MPNSSKPFLAQSLSPVRPNAEAESVINAGKKTEDKSFTQAQSTNLSKLKGQFAFSLSFGKEYFLHVTRRLLVCVFIAITCYWFAALVANEWLYLLSCGFIVASCLGVILPYLQLSQVTVEGLLPSEVVVSDSADCLISLKKVGTAGFLSSLLPLHSIKLDAGLVRLTGEFRQPEMVLTAPDVLIDVATNEISFKYLTPALRRGIYRLEKIRLFSGFPFGLGYWTRTLDVSNDAQGNPLQITVYPKSIPIHGTFLCRLPGLTSYMGLSSASSKLVEQSSSVRSIREFRTGDSLRHVHWPSTARLGKLLVREYDSETLPAYNILLDLKANWKSKEQFEFVVLIVYSLSRLGHTLGTIPDIILNPPLDSPQLQEMMSDLPQIPPGIELICEILARVEPVNVAQSRTGSSTLPPIIERKTRGRPFLGIFPHVGKMLVAATAEEERLVDPVDLVRINGIIETPLLTAQSTESKIQFKVARDMGDTAEEQRQNWSIDSQTLAVLSNEAELRAL